MLHIGHIGMLHVDPVWVLKDLDSQIIIAVSWPYNFVILSNQAGGCHFLQLHPCGRARCESECQARPHFKKSDITLSGILFHIPPQN